MSRDPANERADDTTDPKIGTLLGGAFLVVRLLGRGGMGAVYEVRGPRGEALAAKLITRGSNGASVAPHEVSRLLREGRAATTIVSPYVVRALVVDTDGATGLPFLILQLLSGLDLAKLVAKHAPLPPAPMARVTRQAALGLAAAHAKGIVHRDVKPANLFLDVDASGHMTVKVCDFGIAKHDLDRNDMSSTELTQTDGLIGSPAYMSPEQTQSSKLLDARTDVWSLAVVLYEALSGQRLWPPQSPLGELILAICTKHIPRLETIAPWLDPALCDVVHRGLERDLAARWPSAKAFAEALSPFTGGSDEVRFDELVRDEPERRGPRPRASSLDAAARAAKPDATTETRDERMLHDTTATAPSALRRQRGQRGVLVGVVVAAAASLLVLLILGVHGPPSVSSHGVTAPACTENRACIAKNHGEPAICRATDRVCASLESTECHVLASPGDIESDSTIWIGAMLPLSGPMAESYGKKERDAIELGRLDFHDTVHGLPPIRPGGPRRSIGVVMCDDAKDPARVATHLIEDLGVSAVIGFALSNEVVDLASSHFTPRGVLALATNTSTTLRSIPTTPGEPRLVWRTTVSTDMMVAPRVALLRDLAEPRMRAMPDALAPGERVRVALVRIGNSSGLATADRMVDSLRFNGKSVAENGDAFRQIVMSAEADSEPDGAEMQHAAAQIAAFRPHVVMIDVDDPILPEVERAWPISARFRPMYLGPRLDDPATMAWVREHPDLRTRAFGTDTITTTSAVAKHVLRHNEVFETKITSSRSGVGTYDAFYLLAYTMTALGSEPISGRALARAIPRLMPPGPRIDVGPAGIVDVLHTLESGANVDLVGTTTSLDFDLEAGEASADFDVLCATPSGAAPSGLVFRTREQSLEGKLSCPGW